MPQKPGAVACKITFTLCLIGVLWFEPLAAQPRAQGLLLGSQNSSREGPFRMAGVVLDQSGAAIGGAEVTVQSGDFSATKTTNSEGQFEFTGLPSRTSKITVRANGFSTDERNWRAREKDFQRVQIVLAPAPVTERVTVTATRTAQRLGDTASDVAVLTSRDLDSTAALTLDDKLRQVPGFQLFRRSGSRVANPTSQGASLRGVGASGASRALVLDDGVPLNDPFGGWVYWDRVPREAVSGVEVVRGAASDLYGTDAMGGVINLIPHKPTVSTLDFEASYGNETTSDASLSASVRLGRWIAVADGEAFHTDGYFVVPQDVRGRVDSRSDSDYRAADFTVDRLISDRARLFVRASYFGEARDNGQVFQNNHTEIRQLAAGANWQTDAAGAFSVRVYGGPQTFDQNFFATALDRNSENLTDVQRSPAQQFGASGQWSRTAGVHQTLVAGIEGDEVRGASNELLYLPVTSRQGTAGPIAIFPGLRSAVGAGGRQNTLGVFGEDIIRLTSRWIVTAGARFDHWRNFDALTVTRPLSTPGPVAVTN